MGGARGFDEDAALEAAMRVFWEKRYEGATIADVTEAMGINRSSMYAAFGDKEAVFHPGDGSLPGGPYDLHQAGSRSAVAAGSRSGGDPWNRGIPFDPRQSSRMSLDPRGTGMWHRCGAGEADDDRLEKRW